MDRRGGPGAVEGVDALGAITGAAGAIVGYAIGKAARDTLWP